jgi:hypothetical protein
MIITLKVLSTCALFACAIVADPLDITETYVVGIAAAAVAVIGAKIKAEVSSMFAFSIFVVAAFAVKVKRKELSDFPRIKRLTAVAISLADPPFGGNCKIPINASHLHLQKIHQCPENASMSDHLYLCGTYDICYSIES